MNSISGRSSFNPYPTRPNTLPFLEDPFRTNPVQKDMVKNPSQIDLMLESGPKPRLMPGLAKLDQDKNESEESDSLATTISKISSEV